MRMNIDKYLHDYQPKDKSLIDPDVRHNTLAQCIERD